MKYPIFYRPEMSVTMPGHTSQSTSKPRLFSESASNGVIHSFDPIKRYALYLAHDPDYVDDFMIGKEPHASASGFTWTAEYAKSQYYTIGSLQAAIEHVLQHGGFAVAPVSGFHHATPKSGKMFCAFSGQVIASTLVYVNTRAVGAYVDLDSHYGNSIDDSTGDPGWSEKCIKFNVNPTGNGRAYINSLKRSLGKIKVAASKGEIQYLVYCHGADSIIGDNLGRGQCTEEEWFECTRLVCEMAKESQLPIVLCLFGGYGDMDRIIDLHVKDADLINKLIQGV